jgi:hypothetical protein
MTKPPDTHIEPSSAAVKRGGRLLRLPATGIRAMLSA